MTNRLLIHCCCVHCSAYTLQYWRDQGHDVTAYWYNPNIHPFTEHERRREALEAFAEGEGIPFIVAPAYDLEKYFRAVAGHEAERCPDCYRLRLDATAVWAAANGFDAFTSSLLISPMQKHDRIVEAARAAGESSGVRFEYADLRKRYSDSRRITKPLELYRQQYCGCLFSEYERFGVPERGESRS
ncbi:epoxyqueuosine reductase QueH [Dehalogenimonas sp. THU2]|uniref:epoxyqueuosine reductase QueH n=1 Tax=Dehalogenimonas sp. THU2 TaxID=3151121 RepID=UPI0032186956